MSEKLVAVLRVEECVIKPGLLATAEDTKEVLKVKAVGFLEGQKSISMAYPMSVHFSVDLGNGVVPPIGGQIRITIERI